MKVWLATGLILLCALGALAVLLVDPGLWTNQHPERRHHAARAPAGERRQVHPRRRSPWALRPGPQRPRVHVAFARPPRAGILFDVQSGRVLWKRRPRRRLPIASLTKMLTALIVARRDRPDDRVPITPQALAYQGSGVGVLPKGRRVPLRDLFDGLLLVSGNDAAIALAQHDAGSVRAFVRRMNRWRARLGLRCSRFSSPSGILDRRNYSCPRDLAKLARADLANPWIRHVASTRHARFPFPVPGGFLDLYNNNPFMLEGMRGTTGLKTGYTAAAGRCYVITQRRRGRELGLVLLDTPNPLDQVPALLRAGAKAEPPRRAAG